MIESAGREKRAINFHSWKFRGDPKPLRGKCGMRERRGRGGQIALRSIYLTPEALHIPERQRGSFLFFRCVGGLKTRLEVKVSWPARTGSGRQQGRRSRAGRRCTRGASRRAVRRECPIQQPARTTRRRAAAVRAACFMTSLSWRSLKRSRLRLAVRRSLAECASFFFFEGNSGGRANVPACPLRLEEEIQGGVPFGLQVVGADHCAPWHLKSLIVSPSSCVKQPRGCASASIRQSAALPAAQGEPQRSARLQ